MLKIYQSALSNKVKQLAAPLDTYFGIDEFIYTYISAKGEFFAISNQPEPSEYYFSSDFYQSTLLIRHPDNYRNGVLLPGVIPNEKQEPDMENKFGYSADTLLALFRKEKEAVHKFLFNTKKHNTQILSFYMNNLSIFNEFCVYFLKEWKSYLKEMEKYTIDIAKLIGPDFYAITYPGQELEKIKNKQLFLKSIKAIPSDFFLSAPFSNQEKACLELIEKGKTLRETAEVLELSCRTVEYYFENIKNKMGCMTKSEVLDRVPYLKLLDIL